MFHAHCLSQCGNSFLVQVIKVRFKPAHFCNVLVNLYFDEGHLRSILVAYSNTVE